MADFQIYDQPLSTFEFKSVLPNQFVIGGSESKVIVEFGFDGSVKINGRLVENLTRDEIINGLHEAGDAALRRHP